VEVLEYDQQSGNSPRFQIVAELYLSYPWVTEVI
jgi:hypothetical protein